VQAQSSNNAKKKKQKQKQTKTTNKVEIKRAHFYNCSPKPNPKHSPSLASGCCLRTLIYHMT
jgi:hypothetical protein